MLQVMYLVVKIEGSIPVKMLKTEVDKLLKTEPQRKSGYAGRRW